ncbi:Uncharacterized protein PBTT_09248 [Plasmodiophora brassicae]
MDAVWVFAAIAAVAGVTSAAYWEPGDECYVDRNGTAVRTVVEQVFGFGVFRLADSVVPERVRITKPNEVFVNVTTLDQARQALLDLRLSARQLMTILQRMLDLTDARGSDTNIPEWLQSDVVVACERLIINVTDEITPDLIDKLMVILNLHRVHRSSRQSAPQRFWTSCVVLSMFRSFGLAIVNGGDPDSNTYFGQFVRLSRSPLFIPTNYSTAHAKWLEVSETYQWGGVYSSFSSAVLGYSIECALWAPSEHPELVHQAALSLVRNRRDVPRPLVQELQQIADSILERRDSGRIATLEDVSTLLLMIFIDWDYSRHVPLQTLAGAIQQLGPRALLQIDLLEMMIGAGLGVTLDAFAEAVKEKIRTSDNTEFATVLAVLDNCLSEPARSRVNHLDIVVSEFNRPERQAEAGFFGPPRLWGLGAWRAFVSVIGESLSPTNVLSVPGRSLNNLSLSLLPVLTDSDCDRVVPLLEWRCLGEESIVKAYEFAVNITSLGAGPTPLLASAFESVIWDAIHGNVSDNADLCYALMGYSITRSSGKPLPLQSLPYDTLVKVFHWTIGTIACDPGLPGLLFVAQFLADALHLHQKSQMVFEVVTQMVHIQARPTSEPRQFTRWAALDNLRRDRIANLSGRCRAALYLARFPCSRLLAPNPKLEMPHALSAIDIGYNALWNEIPPTSVPSLPDDRRTTNTETVSRPAQGFLLPATTLGMLSAAAIAYSRGRRPSPEPSVPARSKRRERLMPIVAWAVGALGGAAVERMLIRVPERISPHDVTGEDFDSSETTFADWMMVHGGCIIFGIVTLLCAINLAIILKEFARQPRPRDIVYRPPATWDWTNVANTLTDNDFAVADGWPA